jgi:hypothetical protein
MSKFITRPRAIGAAFVCVVAMSGFGAGYAVADQPQMRDALNDLISAKHHLEAALRNKAGHRVKALADIDAAIAEVNLGIAAGE